MSPSSNAELEIVLSSQYPPDFHDGGLDDLVEILEAKGFEVYREFRESRSPAPPPWEVVQIVIGAVGSLQTVAGIVKAWQQRRKRKKMNRRAQLSIIYGPDGEELARVEIGEGPH